MTHIKSTRLSAILFLLASACGHSDKGGSSTPTPENVPTPADAPERRKTPSSPTVLPPVPTATPARPEACRASCEEVIGAFLARNGGRHPFRLSLLPQAQSSGTFAVVPSPSNPREGTFRFESTQPQELPFLSGTYVLEQESLALFATPESAAARAAPLLFRHAIVGPERTEILSHVYVVDPTRKHVPLYVFP